MRARQRLPSVPMIQIVASPNYQHPSGAGLLDGAANRRLERRGPPNGRPVATLGLDPPDNLVEIEQRRGHYETSRLRRASATGLARRPTSFTGPTQEGHPLRQPQLRIVSRPRA